MSNQYRQLFNENITSKIQSLIIKYKPQTHNYTYQGFSHTAESNSLDSLTNLIIDDIVFYAFSEKEIVEHHNNFNLLDDLRAAAKYAYKQRLPKRENANSDGLLGEVILDLFIQEYSPTSKKLVARAKHTEINTKKEITGYDALYFTKDEDGISFWLGQAKAGTKTYCKSSIVDDLEEKYKKDYFSDTAFYIADKKDTNELDDILNGINKICFDSQRNNWDKETKVESLFKFLQNKAIKVKIPCLITYTQDIYNDSSKIEELINKEITDIVNYIDGSTYPIEVNLNWELLFWIFPVKDVDYIRNELVKLKKEAT